MLERWNKLLWLCLIPLFYYACSSTNAPEIPQSNLVSAGPDKILVLPQNEITVIPKLKAHRTFINRYEWSSPDLKEEQLRQIARGYGRASGLEEGKYRIFLTAYDTLGKYHRDSMIVSVMPTIKEKMVSIHNSSLKTTGRFLDSATTRTIQWAGTTIIGKFSGTSLRVVMEEKARWANSNYYFMLNERPPALIELNSADSVYTLAINLERKVHSFRLIRIAGAWQPPTTFHGFLIDEAGDLQPLDEAEKLKIEFYGNSITEGGSMPDQPFTNAYLGHAYQTALKLNADASLVCKSGLGLVKGYCLPETLSTLYKKPIADLNAPDWDFTLWQPDVVVINFLQNDSWTQEDTPDSVFTQQYKDLLIRLREKRPEALIICALGSMDIVKPESKWPKLLTDLLLGYQEEYNDKNVHTFFFPFIGGEDHPNAGQASLMADDLASFIKKRLKEKKIN